MRLPFRNARREPDPRLEGRIPGSAGYAGGGTNHVANEQAMSEPNARRQIREVRKH